MKPKIKILKDFKECMEISARIDAIKKAWIEHIKKRNKKRDL